MRRRFATWVKSLNAKDAEAAKQSNSFNAKAAKDAKNEYHSRKRL